MNVELSHNKNENDVESLSNTIHSINKEQYTPSPFKPICCDKMPTNGCCPGTLGGSHDETTKSYQLLDNNHEGSMVLHILHGRYKNLDTLTPIQNKTSQKRNAQEMKSSIGRLVTARLLPRIFCREFFNSW
jgi:hypothetical protein